MRAARQKTAPERRLLHAPLVTLNPAGARLAEVAGGVQAPADVVCEGHEFAYLLAKCFPAYWFPAFAWLAMVA